MNTPIADKKIKKDMYDLFLLDKFFRSINAGIHHTKGRRIMPWLDYDENDY